MQSLQVETYSSPSSESPYHAPSQNLPPTRRSQRSSVAITVAVIAAAVYTAAAPLRAGAAWPRYLQDDCFYYLKIAQNLASGHGSTFNQIVPTNGYHPLWLLLLTLFRLVLPNAPFVFFIEVAVFSALLATYFLTQRLLRASVASVTSPIVNNALAALVTGFSAVIFYTGMEVILALPLALWFILLCQRADLARQGLRSAFLFGLVASTMILARIDTVLLLGLVVLALLLHPRLRPRLRLAHLLGLALGLTPVLAYFLSNRILFHTWLPVSGMAKQMKTTHLISAQPWESLFEGPHTVPIILLPILLALPLLPRLYRSLSDNEQIVFPVVLLWPFAYVFMLSLVSDWQLWTWYFYPFRPALAVSLIVFCRWQPTMHLLRKPLTAALLVLLAFGKALISPWRATALTNMYEIAVDVQAFASTHPGIYAMGDRSGIVAYLLPYPMVQTEGLVMDRTFLEAIRQQRQLRDAVAPYRARFYIATQTPPYSPCFHAVEPLKAGSTSPHLTQELCSPPLAVFDQGEMRTAIYDLQSP